MQGVSVANPRVKFMCMAGCCSEASGIRSSPAHLHFGLHDPSVVWYFFLSIYICMDIWYMYRYMIYIHTHIYAWNLESQLIFIIFNLGWRDFFFFFDGLLQTMGYAHQWVELYCNITWLLLHCLIWPSRVLEFVTCNFDKCDSESSFKLLIKMWSSLAPRTEPSPWHFL